SPGLVSWLRWAWYHLTSMRTALVLLFLLAVASVPGSVLPQQGIDPQAVQQYYAAHPALAPLLDRLSLFNVFASPWFAAIYLLVLLAAVCVGGMFGYKANRLLVVGDSFANTATALDAFHPGRAVSAADLQPFTIALDKFEASYITSGGLRGQPSRFDALIRYA